jgi:hypothetical protein
MRWDIVSVALLHARYLRAPSDDVPRGALGRWRAAAIASPGRARRAFVLGMLIALVRPTFLRACGGAEGTRRTAAMRHDFGASTPSPKHAFARSQRRALAQRPERGAERTCGRTREHSGRPHHLGPPHPHQSAGPRLRRWCQNRGRERWCACRLSEDRDHSSGPAGRGDQLKEAPLTLGGVLRVLDRGRSRLSDYPHCGPRATVRRRRRRR